MQSRKNVFRLCQGLDLGFVRTGPGTNPIHVSKVTQMNKGKLLFGFVLLALVLLCSVPYSFSQDQADMIFTNGKILTVSTDSGDFPIAEAVAIKGGKILAVGSNSDILKLAGPATKKVNLNGKAMLPGLINTHKHPNRDALMNFHQYLPTRSEKFIKAAGMIFDWNNKDAVLAQIGRIVQSADPELAIVVVSGRPLIGWVGYGSTMILNAPPPGFAESRGILVNDLPRLQIMPQDLDKVSGGRPVMILVGGGGVMNSKALEMAFKKFPGGRYGFEAVLDEYLPQPTPEMLAPLYELELRDRIAPFGYTTVSSRFSDDEIATFGLLDQAGKMPVRVGYAQQVGPVQLPAFDGFVRHLKDVEGKYKSDMLWMTGLTGVPLDGSPDGGAICASFPRLEGVAKNYIFDSNACFNWRRQNDPQLEVLRRLNKLGYRFSNMHSWGNLAVEEAMEFYKEISKDNPVKGRRFAFDHTGLLSQKAIDLSKELGIYWSIIPTALATQRGMLMRQVFGDEIVNGWAGPAKKLVDAGVRITFEGEFEAANPWQGMQFLVTRIDDSGKVRGGQNALDPKTALREMTRWGAEYVLREKMIGSIEPGKYADLIVVDKNPVDPNLPGDRIWTIRTLLTLVGGKVVWRATDFEM